MKVLIFMKLFYHMKNYQFSHTYTFCLKTSTTIPIIGVDRKCWILATYTASAVGFFLPVQLIHQGKTERSLPKYRFSEEFHVTYTKNHWSNFEKCVDFFKKIIFEIYIIISDHFIFHI